MLKVLVTLWLGVAILLQASVFVASKSGGLDHDSDGSTPVTQSIGLGTASGADEGPVRLVP